MTDRLARSLPSRAGAHRAFVRLRGRAWPILQTAAAAVAAWYAAELLLDEQAPVFAPIAAVIALGAAYGQRRERALELVGGVVLGIGLADLLVQGIGSGGWQLGVLVLVAMSTAVMLGGGPVLVTEAGVSAILLVLLEPSGTGLPPSRLVEAVIGGAIALAVAALAFPPDPVLHVGRSVQSVFGGLGRTLEELAAALANDDAERAESALASARALDEGVRALEDALELGRETARFAPGRRASRGALDRYERPAHQIDYAVLDTRVLARHTLRYLRAGGSAPPALADAIGGLAGAVWALAAALDDPGDSGKEARRLAADGAALATRSFEERPDLALAEIVAQVRSTAIDIVRAAEAGAGDAGGAAPGELTTEELLAAGEPTEGVARPRS
jgi:uncharacterized membrane protein YgaE (UPF0421/DUF939 family)